MDVLATVVCVAVAGLFAARFRRDMRWARRHRRDHRANQRVLRELRRRDGDGPS